MTVVIVTITVAQPCFLRFVQKVPAFIHVHVPHFGVYFHKKTENSDSAHFAMQFYFFELLPWLQLIVYSLISDVYVWWRWYFSSTQNKSIKCHKMLLIGPLYENFPLFSHCYHGYNSYFVVFFVVCVGWKDVYWHENFGDVWSSFSNKKINQKFENTQNRRFIGPVTMVTLNNVQSQFLLCV